MKVTKDRSYNFGLGAVLKHSGSFENFYPGKTIEKLNSDPVEVGADFTLCMKLKPRNSNGDQTQEKRWNTDSTLSFFYAIGQPLIGNIQFASRY